MSGTVTTTQALVSEGSYGIYVGGGTTTKTVNISSGQQANANLTTVPLYSSLLGPNGVVLYNWNPSSQLSNFISATQAGNASIEMVGDSITAGYGSDGASYNNINLLSPSAELADGLTESYLPVKGTDENFNGFGYYDPNNYNELNQNVVLSNGATINNSYYGAGGIDANLASNGSTLTVNIPGATLTSFSFGSGIGSYNSVEVTYLDTANNGKLNIVANGNDVVGSITLAGGNSGKYITTTVSIPETACSSISLVNESSQPVYVNTLSLNQTGEINVLGDGISGYSSAQILDPNASPNSVATLQNISDLGAVISQKPSLVFYSVGIDDIINNVPLSTTVNNITTAVNALQAANIDVVLVIPPPINSANFASEIGGYRSAIESLAQQKNIGVVDLSASAGDNYNNLANLGLESGDGVHPNATYYGNYGKILAGLVQDYITNSNYIGQNLTQNITGNGGLLISNDTVQNNTSIAISPSSSDIITNINISNHSNLSVNAASNISDVNVSDTSSLVVGFNSVASNVTMSNNGFCINNYGTTINNVINAGGTEIDTGGQSYNVTINGGIQEVNTFGGANNTTINYGALWNNSGGESGGVVNSLNNQIGWIISNGNGANTNDTAQNGGMLYAENGGTFQNATIEGNSYGFNNMGTFNGGSITGNGVLFDMILGTVKNMTVSGGQNAALYLWTNTSTTQNITVDNAFEVDFAGNIQSSTAQNNGLIDLNGINGRATANTITLNHGGVLDVQNGSVNEVNMAQDGASLFITANTGHVGQISGFDMYGTGDTIVLQGYNYSNSDKVSLTGNNVLQVTDGNSVVFSVQLDTNNNYAGHNFYLTNSGGNIVITDPIDTTNGLISQPEIEFLSHSEYGLEGMSSTDIQNVINTQSQMMGKLSEASLKDIFANHGNLGQDILGSLGVNYNDMMANNSQIINGADVLDKTINGPSLNVMDNNQHLNAMVSHH